MLSFFLFCRSFVLWKHAHISTIVHYAYTLTVHPRSSAPSIMAKPSRSIWITSQMPMDRLMCSCDVNRNISVSIHAMIASIHSVPLNNGHIFPPKTFFTPSISSFVLSSTFFFNDLSLTSCHEIGSSLLAICTQWPCHNSAYFLLFSYSWNYICEYYEKSISFIYIAMILYIQHTPTGFTEWTMQHFCTWNPIQQQIDFN